MTRTRWHLGYEKLARLILRLGLGGVFIYAGAVKMRDPQAFADAVAAYRILPELCVNVFALALPFMEVLIGFWLIIGRRLRSGAFCAAATLLVFWSALVSARFRGLQIDCGCFGETDLSGGTTQGAWALARDGALTGGAWLLYWLAWRKARTEGDRDNT